MKIELQRATLVRGRRAVLSSFSLSFDPGITVLLGPNGAGKSTLMAALGQLYSPRAGVLLCDGRPVTPRTRREMLDHVGYMPQNWRPLPGFTARQSVEYAAWLKGLAGPELTEASSFALASVRMTDLANRGVRRLSGGEQRRVGLAEALVHRPEIVFLDEPTVGLDPDQLFQLRSVLRATPPGNTVVLSTHMIDDVAALADRVVILGHGMIRFDGSPDELRTLGRAHDDIAGDSELERGYSAALEGGLENARR